MSVGLFFFFMKSIPWNSCSPGFGVTHMALFATCTERKQRGKVVCSQPVKLCVSWLSGWLSGWLRCDWLSWVRVITISGSCAMSLHTDFTNLSSFHLFCLLDCLYWCRMWAWIMITVIRVESKFFPPFHRFTMKWQVRNQLVRMIYTSHVSSVINNGLWLTLQFCTRTHFSHLISVLRCKDVHVSFVLPADCNVFLVSAVVDLASDHWLRHQILRHPHSVCPHCTHHTGPLSNQLSSQSKFILFCSVPVTVDSNTSQNSRCSHSCFHTVHTALFPTLWVYPSYRCGNPDDLSKDTLPRRCWGFGLVCTAPWTSVNKVNNKKNR